MPFLALNCRLKVEQVHSDCNDSDDDPLALALHYLRFLLASKTYFLITQLLLF